MTDKLEKILLDKKSSNLSSDEKKCLSFWFNNLKEQDKNNVISLIKCLRRVETGLYAIGTSLEGKRYEKLDFYVIDKDITKIIERYSSKEAIEFGDNFLKYSIGTFSEYFNTKQAGTTKSYFNYDIAAVILLQSKTTNLDINLVFPIKDDRTFYSTTQEFESDSKFNGLVVYRSK